MKNDRKSEIIQSALKLARTKGYTKVSRNMIAADLDCTPPVIHYHFGTMAKLRRAVMRAAVQQEDLVVIAQGLAAGDEQAKKAPESIKREALGALL